MKYTLKHMVEGALKRCEEHKELYYNLFRGDEISMREYDEEVLKAYKQLEKQLLRVMKGEK